MVVSILVSFATCVILAIVMALCMLVVFPVTLLVDRKLPKIGKVLMSFLEYGVVAAVSTLACLYLWRYWGVEFHKWMLIAPILACLNNDLNRIRAAGSGTSRVAMMLRASGEEYDTTFNVQLEKAAMCGNLVGIIVGHVVFTRIIGAG